MEKYRLLEDVCEILDSQRIPITASERKAGGYPYYGANGIQDYVDNYIFDDDLVLLAEDGGNFGSRDKPIAYRVSGKCWVNNHAHVLKPKSTINVDYLCYTLMFYDTTGLVNGATRQKLTQSAMRQMKIPFVKMDVQNEIVKKINLVVDLIGKRKKQLEKLDELVKARFVELFGTIHDNKFGYEIKTLQDVCEQIKDGTHQTPTYTDDSVNGYKFLSSKDVTTGKIDWTHLKYIPEELHNELYARITPKKGDILLAKNGTTGIAATVDRDEIFDIYVSLALLRPIEINSVYLWAAINSVETKQQFDSSLKGIGVPNLHLGEIKKARIIVPAIELQNQFAAFVEQTDKSKLEVQKSLEKLEVLKKALMQKYFGYGG
mgnify:CR=1 FL=1